MRCVARLCLLLEMVLIAAGTATAQQVDISPVIGGFPADSGFSAGVEVVRTRLIGPIDGRIKAIASVKKYELLEAGGEIPYLTGSLALKFTGRYENHPEDDFWGLGNETRKDQRASYLIEGVDTTAGLQWFRGG